MNAAGISPTGAVQLVNVGGSSSGKIGLSTDHDLLTAIDISFVLAPIVVTWDGEAVEQHGGDRMGDILHG